MKNIISILSLLLISSIAFAEMAAPIAKPQQGVNKGEELSWVDEQIKAILPPRKGTSVAYIDTVTQPFIFVIVTKTGKDGVAVSKTSRVYKRSWKAPLKVTIIINSKALIAGKWCSVNDWVQGYKVAAIGENTVKLVKNKKTKILSIKQDNRKIQINTK
ncbi:hypothetical protein [Sulfurimonas sp. HSL3-2]|uniref:hypothetical protein n=1 Tax=Hydrocurvibacter mobilis TaxID=3131936 RepID=UPI0031F908F8